MNKYDPAIAPDPFAWLSLDEQERISLAEEYHKKANLKLPNLKVHALIHVVVENQLAEGLHSTANAIPRLMGEGLSRHDAIHTVGIVVAEQFFAAIIKFDSSSTNSPQERFDAAVELLSAKDWKRQFGKQA